MLSFRDHSGKELARKLSRKGHAEESIRLAVERFREAGYVDDAKFARSVVRRRALTKGPRAIAAELASLGIDRSAAEAALDEFGPDEQLTIAVQLAERMYGHAEAHGFREVLDKIGPKLIRRGFSRPIAHAACLAVYRTDHPAA